MEFLCEARNINCNNCKLYGECISEKQINKLSLDNEILWELKFESIKSLIAKYGPGKIRRLRKK